MVKFALSSLALLLATTSTEGFAPSNTNIIQQQSIQQSSSTNLYDAATAAVESPPLAPLTIWGQKIEDISTVQTQYKSSPSQPDFAPTISAKDLGIQDDKDAQIAYITENAYAIKEKMVENGAVIFRDFDLMKEQDGFVKFYETLGMKTCLDPLHSVSARPTVDGKKGSPVYEAVNKESRKNFFIGEWDDL